MKEYSVNGMRNLGSVLLLCLFLAGGAIGGVAGEPVDGTPIADRQDLTTVEKKVLKKAIEDYEFQEQAKAIDALETLRQNHPTNLEILKYIGLSYEESQRYAEAQGAYAQWIKYSGNRMDADARFAWVGMAKAYDKSKQTAMGVKLLRQWLAKHPDDYDATVALGDMLVREKDYDGTKTMFNALLSRPDVPANYQASAHYYLGFIAWLEGDADEVQKQGARVLRVEPEGGFASVIKQLMETPPPRRLGLNVTAGVDGFYVDNVESKPSYNIVTNARGNNSDRTAGTAVNLGLTWNFRHHLAANYNYSGTFYSKRPDLDLGLHMVGVTWAKDGLQIGPRYEFVTMYNKTLYKGIGVDIGLGIGSWMFIESVRNKTFSHTVKVIGSDGNVSSPVDLSALGGWSHSFMVMRQATWGKTLWMLGMNWSAERTHGNATTDKKLNNYNQLGSSISLMYPNGSLLYSVDVNGYIKKYQGVDPAVAPLKAKRKDEYIHIGGGVTWTSEGHARHAFSAKTEWNNNNSNFDFPNLPNGTKDTRSASSAAYSQWKHTIGYMYTW